MNIISKRIFIINCFCNNMICRFFLSSIDNIYCIRRKSSNCIARCTRGTPRRGRITATLTITCFFYFATIIVIYFYIRTIYRTIRISNSINNSFFLLRLVRNTSSCDIASIHQAPTRGIQSLLSGLKSLSILAIILSIFVFALFSVSDIIQIFIWIFI